ncbi:MAG: hypothetical protein Fur009_4400 [Candidatus Microgenomates bacterium]
MDYKKALLIGRFQPFHKGHLYLLKKTLAIAEKIIIAIGSESIFDENNPLSFEKRKQIIEKVFQKENIIDRLEKIVGVEDFPDDNLWLENIKKQVGRFDIVVSNNEWTNSIMEKAGFTVVRFPLYKRYLYEGWRIRKLIRQGKKWEDRVPNYIKYQISNIKYTYKKSNIFKYLVLGGSFDYLHKGHKIFLKKAFFLGKFVLVGLTTDDFVKNKFLSASIENYQIRKKNLEKFFKKNKWSNYKIIPISDFTGGADKNKKAKAILVTKNTYDNALKINNLRLKNNLKKLRVIIADDFLADDGKIISSERIRAGEINQNGKNYWLLVNSYLEKKQQLILPDELREILRKPLGKVFKNTKEVINFLKKNNFLKIISVGDFISYELLKNKIGPDLVIFDYKTKKQLIDEKMRKILKKDDFTIEIDNQPGKLTKNSFKTIKNIIQKILTKNEKWRVFVEGEEDLLTIPSILFSPLKSIIFYGHWQYGVVAVEVEEKIKKKIIKILQKFR